jgi:hypothetical protein
LTLCKRIHQQLRRDQAKVYSVHEAEGMCIAQGNTDEKYEFAKTVSVAVASKGG